MRQGLVLIDTAGRMYSIGACSDTSRSIDWWNSPGSWAGGSSPYTWVAGQELSVRIIHTGTNLEFYKKLASDTSFVLMLTQAANTFLGTLDSYGFGIDVEGGANSAAFNTMTIV
jgi:hypothetical protein